MPIFDYTCTNCGNSENDRLVTNADEEVHCLLCDTKMNKLFTGIQVKPGTKHHRPYPTHLLGKGNVKFGKE